MLDPFAVPDGDWCTLPENDAAEEIASARRQLADLRAAKPRTGTDDRVDPLTGSARAKGHGEAAEGRVRAVAARGRLEGLEFDPRMLRSSAAELGAAIAEAMNAALTDLRSKAPSADDPVVDPAALAESLRGVQEQGIAQLASLQQALDAATLQIRARLGR